MTGIYKIENTENGMVYFGQTVDYEKRKAEHIRALNGGYHRNRYLLRAWRKYGSASFVFSFVEACGEQELNELEKAYIADNNSLAPNGYNLTSGGDGVRGLRWGDGSRQKLSATRKGKPRPPRENEHHSDETRAKMSASRRKLWEDETYREAMRVSHTGKVFGEETRKKMGDAHRGIVQSNARKVLCVETGVVYPAVSKIDIGRKIDPSHIYRAISRGTCAYGYHWKML